jgi:t-SNARE complex subunit (syntaxin)
MLRAATDVCHQLALVSNKFRDALQNYQNVERDYRKRYKERVERQFKIGGCLDGCIPCPLQVLIYF